MTTSPHPRRLPALLTAALCALPAAAATPAPAQEQSPTAAAADVTIVMEKSECFGSCPAYRLTLHGDGSAHYEGLANVGVKGDRDYRIPAAAVAALVEQFQRLGFFSLADRYEVRKVEVEDASGRKVMVPESRSDLPRTTLTLRLGDREKTVEMYYMAPPGLTELAKSIADAAGVARYLFAGG
jgi:Domain of unknown function (DUF6438)